MDILVSVYYFPKAFNLIIAGEEALAGRAMASLIVKTIVLAIVVGILACVLLRVWREPGKEDERDYQFSARGALIANAALVVFVAIIMGQLVFEGLFPGVATKRYHDNAADRCPFAADIPYAFFRH